jgi:hypothetical protein
VAIVNSSDKMIHEGGFSGRKSLASVGFHADWKYCGLITMHFTEVVLGRFTSIAFPNPNRSHLFGALGLLIVTRSLIQRK